MTSKHEGSSTRGLLLMLAALVSRDQGAAIDYLREENRVLRELLGDRRLPLTDTQRRRLAIRAKNIPRLRLLELEPLVTPDTLLRWFRQLVAAKYDGTATRRGGRAPKPWELCELVVRIARDNDGWGYTKIPDVVRLLDHETGRTTGEECLSRVIPLGERHLRHLVREYLEHYHAERPRQGLEGAIIEPANDNAGQGRMLHRKRLDGLLNHYFREAA